MSNNVLFRSVQCKYGLFLKGFLSLDNEKSINLYRWVFSLSSCSFRSLIFSMQLHMWHLRRLKDRHSECMQNRPIDLRVLYFFCFYWTSRHHHLPYDSFFLTHITIDIAERTKNKRTFILHYLLRQHERNQIANQFGLFVWEGFFSSSFFSLSVILTSNIIYSRVISFLPILFLFSFSSSFFLSLSTSRLYQDYECMCLCMLFSLSLSFYIYICKAFVLPPSSRW